MASRTSKSRVGPSASKAGVIKRNESKIKGKAPPPNKNKPPPPLKEFTLPPFSVPAKPKDDKVIDYDELRKKTKRRNSPEGEDIKEIRAILKGLKNQPVTVHEYVNLMSPYTADNGAILRSTLTEDLENFRRLARKVYGTMTQDVSDVLVNEQLQLTQFYQEKHQTLEGKMLRAINDIYDMAPEFDFDKFAKFQEEYLSKLLPVPLDLDLSPEDIELQKRQETYHRLQWLRTEGERLNEENLRLQQKVNDLKTQQKIEQQKAEEKAKQAEEQRNSLMGYESDLRQTLDMLNDSMEKSVIRNERSLRLETDKLDRRPKKGPPTKRTVKKTVRPTWVTDTAAEIESQSLRQNLETEVSKVSLEASVAAAEKKKKRKKTRKELLHFSPISPQKPSTPPSREASPFHYSPPKETSEWDMPKKRKEESSMSSMRERMFSRGRAPQAPSSSWGGF